ncbi:MAG TPA: NUDIX domain-containing protein [Vicinamibacterales bacterium]
MAKSERLRLGVGAVIRRSDGRVLAFERSDVPGAWQFVQGGVKIGEDFQDALFREVREETGLRRPNFAAVREVPVLLGYELPEPARRKKTGRGQAHKWFFLDFVGDDESIRLEQDGEFRRFRWDMIETIARKVAPFRRPVYAELARWASALPPAKP